MQVFEIQLKDEFGFGYVQMINTSNFGLDNFLLLRIYDFYSQSPYQGNIELFESMNELVAPSLLFGSPKKRGKDKWRILGELGIPKNYKVPIFKFDPTTSSWETMDWNHISWFLVHNLTPNGLDGGYNYSQVKHLPFWRHCPIDSFVLKLTMFWQKKQGIDIVDYWGASDLYNVHLILREVENSQFYSEIPIQLRQGVSLK